MLLSDVCLSDVCLSVAYIAPNSKTERPRKTKIGTEIAHVTRDSDTTFKVKVSRPLYSPPCWHIRQLQRWAWECVGRDKLLLRCCLLGRMRCFGAHREERAGGILCCHAHSLLTWCLTIILDTVELTVYHPCV